MGHSGWVGDGAAVSVVVRLKRRSQQGSNGSASRFDRVSREMVNGSLIL